MQKYYVVVYDDQDQKRASTRWYKNAECTILHRIGGPAIEYADGDKLWYVDGNNHRADGPAVENADGYKAWCINGKRHRIDGPARVWPDGDYVWYLNGKRHCESGPALVLNGIKEWWLDGSKTNEQEHARRTAPAQEMTVSQIEAALGHKVKVVK